MITYTYKCTECEHTFEVKQNMSDAPLVHCPACEEDKLRKVLQPTPFKFNGSNGNYGRGRT